MRRFYIEEKWKKRLLAAGLLLLLAAVYVWRRESAAPAEVYSSESSEASESSESKMVTDESPEEPQTIAIHVSGAVMYPDRVYYLMPGSRVEDAVQAAGGATEEADLSQLNLAAPVSDGQKIRVPVWGEVIADGENSTENTQSLLTNINLATKIELQNLPGIGAAYAERIIEYRTSHGNFQTVEEIMNVKGIGEKVFEKIKELITVN
jgi:competence protein ComEA